jgi:intein-encoded DNA endonuclease-like protein
VKIGQSAGKSWAYLVGVYLGDGCVTLHQGQLVFRLNTIDEDFAVATKDALRAHTDRPMTIHCHSVSKSSKPNHSLRCGEWAIAQRLRDETDSKAKLPDWIWTTDQEGRLAFIAGLMDSEGFVSRNGCGRAYMGFKSTDLWFYDFVRVLNAAGIQVGQIGVEQPRKPGYRTPRRFTIKMASWVKSGAYFNIARKQARVDEWASAQLTSEANMRIAA